MCFSLQAKAAYKNISQNVFQVVDKFFKPRERPTIHELTDTFFVDYSMMPLFVQENYLKHRDSSELWGSFVPFSFHSSIMAILVPALQSCVKSFVAALLADFTSSLHSLLHM